MNIISIFSGKKYTIDIFKKYLQQALDLNIIDEVHIWNNTRDSNNENYLKNISNLKRTSSTKNDNTKNENYILITPVITNNSFEFNVKASNDISIKITNMDTEYQIILGGWNNTKSTIKENNIEIFRLLMNNIADIKNFNNFKFLINDNILNILKNNELIISQKVQDNFEIKNIYFKTGYNSVADLNYNTTKNKGFYFMDTCEKSSKNYYNYYNDKKFENDIIIKCDDIVFIDLHKLPKFIQFIKNNEYDLVFANTINNGVSAYFQQNKYNLIPKELIDLEYPNDGLCGSLWESGEKAEKLHNYFIENYKKFLDYEYNNEIIQIDTRFSINFFGYKGKNWHKIVEAYNNDEDEYKLTVYNVKNKKFKNILYTDFYVSHLSFLKQVETGININNLVCKYHKLYNTIMNKEDGIDTLEDLYINSKIIIIHYKFSVLANAPDEIYELQKKNETELINYYLINNDKNKLNNLININSNNKIIIHFHNKILPISNSNNIKKIIHYHSEPSNVNLSIDNTFKKLVLNQYHCLLPEYKGCKIVRNFFNYKNPIIFNQKIKIGFYPSVIKPYNKYFDKGYTETKPILDNIQNFFGENIIVEILYGIPYDVCIEKKSECHIIIDECKTGSFHKSTIEGLMLGCIVIVNITDKLENIHKQLYNNTLPVINTKLNILEEKLKEIILLGKDEIEKLALKNREMFLSYWNDKIVYNEFYNIYEDLLK
jgi:hypothetical protein